MAIVGGHNTRYAYIRGYYEAGKTLIDISLNETYSDKRDIFFYPILYNYRHYLELHLKSLIMDTELLYEKMDELGYLENGRLCEKISNSIDNNHNLNDLLEKFIIRLGLMSKEIFPKEIKKYIKQMYDMDTNGQKFRYHISKSKKLHFQNEEKFDLKNISEIMEKVKNLL